MRNKAPLAMLEQLVMLLVFALAAALCLQAFALADRLSDRTERFDRAVLEAQRAAETVKHCRGDLQQAQALLPTKQSAYNRSVSSPESFRTNRALHLSPQGEKGEAKRS